MSKRDLARWEMVSRNEVADHSIFKTFRCKFTNKADGRTGDFFLIDCSDWVQVIAETEDGRIVLVEQFRFGSMDFSLELPGGIMEVGEGPVEAAARELAEETGFVGDGGELIASLRPNPAIQTNMVNVVAIKNCKLLRDTNFDELEDLSTALVSRRELLNFVKNGHISHCIATAAIFNYILRDLDDIC
jgi:8-oxo-dGTP pyrophosphatase MutT (NUDIX family)